MNPRFWDPAGAFAHPVTVLLVGGAAAIIALAALAILVLSRTGKIGPNLTRELWLRTGAWAVMVPAIVIPVLIGPAWTILAVLALSLLCYQEFARATGLFRERFLSFVVVCTILAIAWSAFDVWYGFFVALFPLGVVAIAVATIPLDRPQHYVQRTSLGVMAFLLFGAGLGHLGYTANDVLYRPILLMLVFSVAVSDVAAFCVGKLIGGPKLAPATSPGKTISGSLGALAVTTLFVIWIAGAIYGPALSLFQRALLGVLVGAGAQLGDLMLSSIKRDLGIKDMGAAIPGHGGVLDRANSLLLVAPAAFHYLHYLVGIGMPEPTFQISTG
jgi:phosphatidate cytidylyltransferase